MVKRADGIYKTRRTASNGFVESIMIHENSRVETAGKRTNFWNDIGACGQRSGFDRSGFQHSFNDDSEEQNEKKGWE